MSPDGAGLDLAMPMRMASLGDSRQAPGQDGGLADEEHLARVAVVAVLDDGDVDVDDVPFFSRLLPGMPWHTW